MQDFIIDKTGERWYYLNFKEALEAWHKKILVFYLENHEIKPIKHYAFFLKIKKCGLPFVVKAKDLQTKLLRGKPFSFLDEKELTERIDSLPKELLKDAFSYARKGYNWINLRSHPLASIYKESSKDLTPFDRLILTMVGDKKLYPLPYFIHVRKIFSLSINLDESFLEESAVYFKKEKKEELYSKGEYIELYNLDETTFKTKYPKEKELLEKLSSRPDIETLKWNFKEFLSKINSSLLPIRVSTYYPSYLDKKKDILYLLKSTYSSSFESYVSQTLYLIVSFVRRSMLTKNDELLGYSPSSWYESLIIELSKAILLAKFSLAASLNKKSLAFIDIWEKELELCPLIIKSLKRDVNKILDVISRVEKGEFISTSSLFEKDLKVLSDTDKLILKDVIRFGGYKVDKANFSTNEEYETFKERFPKVFSLSSKAQEGLLLLKKEEEKENNLAFQRGKISEELYLKDLKEIKREKQELRFAFKNSALKAQYEAFKELNDSKTKKKESFFCDYIKSRINSRALEFIVIRDLSTNQADVIIPKDPRQGGEVTFEDKKFHFYITPDEVLDSKERESLNAHTVSNDDVEYDKKLIETLLKKLGASYVRFFQTIGMLDFKVSDDYFKGKEVYKGSTKNSSIWTKARFDFSAFPKIRFSRAQLFKDSDGKTLFLIKPYNEELLSLEILEDDIKKISIALSDEKIVSIKVLQDMAIKYYDLYKRKEVKERDIFSFPIESVNLKKIKDVSFRYRIDGTLSCFIKVESGAKIEPKPIPLKSWMKLFLSSDIKAYKKELAAFLFSDLSLTRETI